MKNKEAMQEIFSDFGVVATNEQIEKITDAFESHLYNIADMERERHSGGDSMCSKCESKAIIIKDLERTIGVYANSVKSRRKCERVWISGDQVLYE